MSNQLNLSIPRDLYLEPITAPLITGCRLKALIDSPQFQQTIVLPSGRTVSYATCGSKTGTPVLYFYGLGGSSRQIASLHAQAVRLDIKLISIDRPGTAFTDPFKSSSSSLFPARRRKYKKKKTTTTATDATTAMTTTTINTPAVVTAIATSVKSKEAPELEASTFQSTACEQLSISKTVAVDHSHQSHVDTSTVNNSVSEKELNSKSDSTKIDESCGNNGSNNINRKITLLRRSFDKDRRKKKVASSTSSSSPPSSPSSPSSSTSCLSTSSERMINARVHHTCLEALAVVDHISPGAKFGLMGHSCGIYYIMYMAHLFSDRLLPGPISLLTPWVPFNECPETTSKTFKFLKHVPKRLVWAVTSLMNHLGSMVLSSSNALSGPLPNNSNNSSNRDLRSIFGEDEIEGGDSSVANLRTKKSKDDIRTDEGDDDASDTDESSADPFIVQFSDSFDKVVLPALVQDMNRQHSNGYNAEIQMCVSDVGFDLAEVAMSLPEGMTINAYCGHLDTIVPIEASREMSQKCGWKIHEFMHSGHGGPRMSMYALEDYARAVRAIKSAEFVTEQFSEKHHSPKLKAQG